MICVSQCNHFQTQLKPGVKHKAISEFLCKKAWLKSDRNILRKVEVETITKNWFRNLFQLNHQTMPVTNKFTDFSGQSFYIGIDVHKKSWTVTVRSLNIELVRFSQTPDAVQLSHYLHKRYPDGRFFSAYEAGFCGTSHHHALCREGIENIIIHPADLPESDKEKKNKTDLHDSRAVAKYLESGVLNGIHVMPVDQQERRSLHRCRQATVGNVTRCTNRLRSLLDYYGVELPDNLRDKEYVSKYFLDWLGKLKLTTEYGTEVLQRYIEDLQYHRSRQLLITRKLKKIIAEHYGQSYSCLLTVPGIGPITAIALLAETGDLSRFKNPDEFCSYLGLVPSEQSSGERVYSTHIQPRCNRHLRPLLIEAAWTAIRRCPVLLAYYRKHAGKNNKKAIVKVARKLALIAKAVAINKRVYQADYGYRMSTVKED
jgi:transposase